METREDRQGYEARDERSIGALVSELSQETTTLLQQEIALAKTEMSEKVSQVSTALVRLALGGLVLFAGLLVLLDALVYGLSELLPPDLTPWLPALIVGIVVAIIGAILLQKGRSNLQTSSLMPQRTATSLQRDTTMVKEQVR
jgi:drug/metabolite transporter (DMT)-like permease